MNKLDFKRCKIATSKKHGNNEDDIMGYTANNYVFHIVECPG